MLFNSILNSQPYEEDSKTTLKMTRTILHLVLTEEQI